jgi:hypothetical protein
MIQTRRNATKTNYKMDTCATYIAKVVSKLNIFYPS